MKYLSIILLLFFASFFPFGTSAKTSNSNEGFVTESVTEEEKNTVLKNISISKITKEPERQPIECFDVNENGEIAIGIYTTKEKIICIYSDDGTFQYGYKFYTSGNFGVELKESNLYIYLVRSDIAIGIAPSGEIIEMSKIQNTSENNSYWNNYVSSNKRIVGDKVYILKNDMGIFNLFSPSYSQLIVQDGNGNQNIIYDVNSSQLTKNIIILLSILAFSAIVISCVVVQTTKSIKGRR
ncbi:MAG: hypothetical protein IJW19_04130 [Clostridia bacterium]|nr:hypothetical protein [Clostridia bacterium]